MQTIKAVIFDIDGTLADTIPLCTEALRQAIEPLVHRPLSNEEIEATFGPSEEHTVKELAPDADSTKGIADFLHHYESLHDKMCPAPFDGITALLNTLKERGVKLAIATGKGKESSDITLQRFSLVPFFEIIENGSPESSRKQEAIPKILMALGGIKKEEAIYVGDSPGDIKDCRQVGITVVTAAWAGTTKKREVNELQPDEFFHTVQDFANWLSAKI